MLARRESEHRERVVWLKEAVFKRNSMPESMRFAMGIEVRLVGYCVR